MAGGGALGRALESIKEQLRALPDNGLGYGVLRYLKADGCSPGRLCLATDQRALNKLAANSPNSSYACIWASLYLELIRLIFRSPLTV